MSGTVVTELQVLDRLSPVTEMVVNTWPAWPFVPKDSTENNSALDITKSARVPTNTMRTRLSRTTSLDRIKQFPAYLCSRGILPHALAYLQTSSTAVQAGLTFVRGSFLIVAVYLSVFILTLQLSACFCALLMGTPPPGLIFMMASLILMCGIACKTIVHDSSVAAKPNTRTHSD